MVATWCQNMWQLATDMKCALWPVALYFNFYIFLVSKNTNLLSCVMQLLTASGRLSHTTRVLAPAQQRTNCIAVARRLFPFSQNEMFLFSWSHKSFIFIFRATGNASAVHEIQFFSSSSLCTLCAHLCTFVEFLLRLCLFGSGAQRKIRIKACLRTSVYLSLWDIAPYCPVTSCNVQFYFPSSVLIVQGQLNLSHFCAPRSLLA